MRHLFITLPLLLALGCNNKGAGDTGAGTADSGTEQWTTDGGGTDGGTTDGGTSGGTTDGGGTDGGTTDGGTTDGGTTDGGTTAAECTAAVLWLDPADGDEAVPTDAGISAGFSEPARSIDDISITVTGPDGDLDGSLSLSDDGLSATFLPAAELAFDTPYLSTVTACDTFAQASFTTLTPPLDATTVLDKTYVLGLGDATWNAPAGMEILLPTLGLDTASLMAYVEDVNVDKELLYMVGAIGFEDRTGTVVQYPCAEPARFPEADFSDNPLFEAGPGELRLDTDFGDVPLYDLYFYGTFSADGSQIQDMRVTALLDVRNIEYSGLSGCDIVGLFVTCEPCPDSAVECVYIDAEADVDEDPSAGVDPDLDPSLNPVCGG